MSNSSRWRSLLLRGGGRGRSVDLDHEGGSGPPEGLQAFGSAQGPGPVLLLELLDQLCQRALPQRLLLPSLPKVHSHLLLLLLANHQDVVKLRHLCLPDLLVQCPVAQVDLGVQAPAVQGLPDVARVLARVLRDRHNHALPRRQPEGPLACEVLGQHACHALDGAEDGPVQNDRPSVARLQHGLGVRGRTTRGVCLGSLTLRIGRACRVLHILGALPNRLVLQIEPKRQLEVQLHGTALVLATQRILQLDVDLRAVECSVALVDGPLPAARIERVGELRLRALPELLAPHGLLRPCAQRERELEAEQVVDVEHELKRRRDLRSNLIFSAKDVGIVLLKSANPRQSRKCATQLVPVQDTERGHSHGQLAVGAWLAVEDDTVARAIHRFQEPFLALDLEAVHVVFVVLVVPGALEDIRGVDVRRDDLVEAPIPILRAHQLLQPVVDLRPMAGPEARSWGHHGVEEEQVLLLADPPVVTLLRLLQHCLMGLQLFGRGEGHTIDAL
mmetsp:Transcript_17763/g.49244  ORF Transcript_17763/g.49244 Transcript_17763/m.49244 type:complete len:502 (-) Transcript_17763:893-2398(-)